ncbi:MAG: RDD family protein [Planctomycetaceae bacterium]|nr:MAG: RDD family protein [Planctomycetaceae bacterium]
MNWFYVNSGLRYGPLSDTDFQTLVQQGTITATTLVWQPGMFNWMLFKDIAAASAPSQTQTDLTKFCCQCGRYFNPDDMLQYKNHWICYECKPLFFQRIREDADVGAMLGMGDVEFGGFWLRTVALAIDWTLLAISLIALDICYNLAFSKDGEVFNPYDMGGLFLPAMALACVYETFFVGRYAATPGKIACGLRVVVASGARVTTLRAFGRYWGKMLSFYTLMIGFFLAISDGQKRTLHDHLCETRVVRR